MWDRDLVYWREVVVESTREVDAVGVINRIAPPIDPFIEGKIKVGLQVFKEGVQEVRVCVQRYLDWESVAPGRNVWEGALPMCTDGTESYVGCTCIHFGGTSARGP